MLVQVVVGKEEDLSMVGQAVDEGVGVGVGEGTRAEIPGREKGKEKPEEVGTEDEGVEEEEKN